MTTEHLSDKELKRRIQAIQREHEDDGTGQDEESDFDSQLW
jgi:hypothetical protein